MSITQKGLPFKYEEEKKDRGITAIQICEGTYTDKRGDSGMDRYTGNNVTDIVKSCWGRLCRGFGSFGSR